MKEGKAAGPSEIVAEMLNAAGKSGVAWITDICNLIIKDGTIPEDWKKSWIVSLYNRKGDPLDCNYHRRIKLLDHAMKVFERVIERRVRNNVELDEMQFQTWQRHYRFIIWQVQKN